MKVIKDINDDKPKVLIIILHWKGLENTIECLKSVKNIDYPNYNVLVIDNASHDNPEVVISKRFPEASVIKNVINMGYAGGNNIGIKYGMKSGAKYFWLLNNDTVVKPDTLKKLISVAESTSRAGLLSPVIYYYNTPSKIQFCGSYVNWSECAIHDFNSLKEADENKDICLWGTALLIKREVVESIGYLDDRFFAYGEDIDYSFRSLQRKFVNRIVLSAKIYHKLHNVDIGKNKPAHYFYYTTRNRFWFWNKALRWDKKIIFMQKYIVRALRDIGHYKKEQNIESVDACLDGVYSVLRNVGGEWNKNIKMPKLLKKLILSHPWFLADLFEFNISKYFLRSNAKQLNF